MQTRIRKTRLWHLLWALLLCVGVTPSWAFNTGTVSDLAVWLKADAGILTNASGTVTNWLDQSGNGRHGISTSGSNPRFSAASTGLGNQPALTFDGSDSGIYLGDLSGVFPSAATLFMVASINNDSRYNLFVTKNNASWWRYEGDGKTYPGFFRTTRLEGFAFTPANGACFFQVDSSAALWQMFTNGVSVGTAAAGYNGGDANGYRIGYGPDAGGLLGDIAEVLIYSRVLSSNEAIKVGAYLVDQYAITVPLIDPDIAAINNASGVSGLSSTSATLNGNLVRTGSSATAVSVYYGPADAGMNTSGWAGVHDFGVTNPVSLPATCVFTVATFSPDTAYYYTYAASNATSREWPRTRENFITGNVWLDKTADASEIGLTPGTVMVHRVATATNCALKVNYRQAGGTAVSNQDYAAFSGQVTIPVGATNAPIIITPLANWGRQANSTLDLTVEPGGYLLGAASNASLTLYNESAPAAPTNAWVAAVAGNASVAGNWSLGHVPQTDERVVLDGRFSQRDMTWDVTTSIGAWLQTTGYAGSVTIATRYDATFPCLVITGNCQVLGGMWTHPVGSSGNTEIYRLRADVGGNFTLGSGATINLNEKGFEAYYYSGYGPGAVGTGANYERGSSHGGLGGNSSVGTPVSWDKVYGSITSPTNLGSSTVTAGGGALYLTVQGTATVDGIVSAVGGNGSYVSAAAGGSILLTVGALSGTGILTVAGGSTGGGGGAGGGGRIAVILTNSSTFGSIAMKAYGGYSGILNQSAAAGTIYRQVVGQAAGEGSVTIDNNNIVTVAAMTLATPNEPDMTHFTEVILTNRGFLAMNTNTLLDWIAQPSLKVYGPNQSLLMVQNTNGVSMSSDFNMVNFTLYLFTNLTVNGDMLVSNATFALAAPMPSNLTVQGTLHIATNGSMAHWIGSEKYRLDVSVGGNFIIDTGATINLDGLGFLPGNGPGAGSAVNGNTAPAASHGGLGAPKPGVGAGLPATYGSILAPTNFGSGAHTYGGGALQMNVAGTSVINGTISAKAGTPNLAAAAGGSIYLVTGWMEGNGTLDVSSPNFNPSSAQYGGGGGRISVILTHSASFGSVTLKAYGCYPGRPAPFPGAAGTIYQQTSLQGAGHGVILVDNNIPASTETNITTQLPTQVSPRPLELMYATLVITNRARVELTSNLMMGDLFLTDDNSRLHLNGYTLTLRAFRHPDWGTPSRVVYDGGQIIWNTSFGTIVEIH